MASSRPMGSLVPCLATLVVCLAGVAVASSSEEAPAMILPDDPTLAVDYVSSVNMPIRFPYFNQTLRSVDPELRPLLVADIIETINFISKVIQEDLEKPSSSPIKWLKITKNISDLASSQAARRRKLGKRFGSSGEFNKAMRAMFAGLMRDGKEAERRYKGTVKDPLALRDQVRDYLVTIREGFAVSPVVSYVDFSAGHIDGRPFPVAIADMMGNLRYNGYARILNLLEVLITVATMFSS